MTTVDPDTTGELGAVYTERAELLALLAVVFPSVISANDPDAPDWPVLYVNGPTGQMSWHLADKDLPLFEHVQRVLADDPRARFDEHTTSQKYARLRALIARWRELGPVVAEHERN